MRLDRLYRATLTLILLFSLAETAAAQARRIRSYPAVNSEGGFSSSHSGSAPVSHQNPDLARSAGAPQGPDGGRSGQAGGGYSGRPHRQRYYGYGYSYPYGYDPYPYGYDSYPYGYISSSLSYAGFPSDDQGEQAAAGAPPEDSGPPPYGPEDELEGQVRQLSDEVAQLRADEGYRPDPGHGPGVDAPEPTPAAPESQLPTVLVYRDGHQMEIQNYAIYGQTVWVFGDQVTRKVAVADLDAARTKQVNDQRGVEFDIPEPPSSDSPIGPTRR